MTEEEFSLRRIGIPKVDLVSSALEEQTRALNRADAEYAAAETIEEKIAALERGMRVSHGFTEVIIKTYGGQTEIGDK